MKWIRHLPLLFSASVACGAMVADGAEAPKPNVIVILADDFGVGDIHAYYPDNKVQTPYLDQLSREGLNFTDAHTSASVCTPSRYGLLTGRYAWRSRLQRHVLRPYDNPLIKDEQLTLAEMFKAAGYATACIGKWHLGHNWTKEGAAYNYSAELTGGAVDHGFDLYFGTDVPNYAPYTFIEGRKPNPLPSASMPNEAEKWIKPGPCAPGWRFDQILPAITDRAVAYIHEQAERKAPFFLYFSMTSPHEPVSPSPAFKGKSEHVMLDFLMETDWSVGQVLQAVEAAGLGSNTVVVFTSDNGANGYTYWKEMVALGQNRSGIYRDRKGAIYEGGHRVPLIVRWPGMTVAGGESSQLVCLSDMMATFADFLGIALPADQVPDSMSFLPSIKSPAAVSARNAVIHHSADGQFAIRAGDWKLIAHFGDKEKRVHPHFALYNLKDDPSETRDMAAENPERIGQMKAALERYIREGRSTPGPFLENDRPVSYEYEISPSEHLYQK